MVRRALNVRYGIATLALAALALGPGCVRIVSETSPYYVNGPDQSAPPQGFLKAGSEVYVISQWGEYARFFNDDGINAAIWSAALVSPAQWDKLQADRKPVRLKGGSPEVIQGEGLAR